MLLFMCCSYKINEFIQLSSRMPTHGIFSVGRVSGGSPGVVTNDTKGSC